MNNKLYRKQVPSTHAMRCFEAAARHLSFTLAAEELNMTQSAVSKQVAMLESTLKIQLFIRVRQRLQLAPAGQLYFQEVTRILALIEEASLGMLSYDNRADSVRIATHPSFGVNWLIPALQGFRERHQSIELTFQDYVDPSELGDANIDVAFIHGEGHWEKLKTIKLFDEVMVPVCSPKMLEHYGEAGVEQLYLEQPLLQCRTRVDAWSEFFDSLNLDHPNGYRGPKFETWTSLIAEAEHDFGVGLVPEFLLNKYLETGRLVKASSQKLDSAGAYYMAYPEHFAAEPKITAIADWVQEHLYEKSA